MQATLLTRRTASLVLAWFVAFIVIAGIAPMVQAQPMDSICTAAGLSQPGPQGGGESDSHAGGPLKCFLCTGLSIPPVVAVVLAPFETDLRHATLPFPAAHLASLTGAPLPARGPPLFS